MRNPDVLPDLHTFVPNSQPSSPKLKTVDPTLKPAGVSGSTIPPKPSPFSCQDSPCTYVANNLNTLRQHKASHHVRFDVVAGSFRVEAIPMFLDGKPMLQCSNCHDVVGDKTTFERNHIQMMSCNWCKFLTLDLNGFFFFTVADLFLIF